MCDTFDLNTNRNNSSQPKYTYSRALPSYIDWLFFFKAIAKKIKSWICFIYNKEYNKKSKYKYFAQMVIKNNLLL